MSKLRVIGLALLALFAVAAVTATSASAAALPEFSVATNYTGTSGTGKLNATGAEIKCTSGSNTGTATNKKEGSVTLKFNTCTLGAKKCNTTGDAAGTILLSDTYALVRLKSAEAGVLITQPEVEIKCEGINIKVRGNVLGVITPILTKTKNFELKVAVVGGKQEKTEYENDAGAKVKAKLEANAGLGFVAATEESAENKLTAASETTIESTT